MVHHEDWRLQGFAWGGKIFFETMLVSGLLKIVIMLRNLQVFGCISSPALFNRMAATVKELAIVESGILERHVKQQLGNLIVREKFIN